MSTQSTFHCIRRPSKEGLGPAYRHQHKQEAGMVGSVISLIASEEKFPRAIGSYMKKRHTRLFPEIFAVEANGR